MERISPKELLVNIFCSNWNMLTMYLDKHLGIIHAKEFLCKENSIMNDDKFVWNIRQALIFKATYIVKRFFCRKCIEYLISLMVAPILKHFLLNHLWHSMGFTMMPCTYWAMFECCHIFKFLKIFFWKNIFLETEIVNVLQLLVFKPGARAWFLEIVSFANVDVCVCVCVLVSAPEAINNKSRERHA